MATINDYNAVHNSLIKSESGGNFNANRVNDDGREFTGRMQFGKERLADLGMGDWFSWEDFKRSPELQQRIEHLHFADIDQRATADGIYNRLGEEFNGTPLTKDSFRAMAHLGGYGGASRFVNSGGKYNPQDEEGTSLSDYYSMHNAPGGMKVPAETKLASYAADLQKKQDALDSRLAKQPEESEQRDMATIGLMTTPQDVKNLQRNYSTAQELGLLPKKSVDTLGNFTAGRDRGWAFLNGSVGPAGGPIPTEAPQQPATPATGEAPAVPAVSTAPTAPRTSGPPPSLQAALGLPNVDDLKAPAMRGPAGGPAPSAAPAAAPSMRGPAGGPAPAGTTPNVATKSAPQPVRSPSVSPSTGEVEEEKKPFNWGQSLFEGLEGVGAGLGQMSVGQAVNLAPTWQRQDASRWGDAASSRADEQLELDKVKTQISAAQEARLQYATTQGTMSPEDRNFIADQYVKVNGDTPEVQAAAEVIRRRPEVAKAAATTLLDQKQDSGDIGSVTTREHQNNVISRAIAAGRQDLADLAEQSYENATYVQKQLEKMEPKRPMPDEESAFMREENFRTYPLQSDEAQTLRDQHLWRMSQAQIDGNSDEYWAASDSLSSMLSSAAERAEAAKYSQLNNSDVQLAKLMLNPNTDPALIEQIKNNKLADAGAESHADKEKIDTYYAMLKSDAATMREGRAKQEMLISSLAQAKQYMDVPNFDSGPASKYVTSIQAMLKDLGYEVDPSAIAEQGFDAIASRLIPNMRVPGSGSTSDWEGSIMMKAIIGLEKDEDANRAILQAMERNSKLLLSDDEAEVLYRMDADPLTGEHNSGLTLKEFQRAYAEKQGLSLKPFHSVKDDGSGSLDDMIESGLVKDKDVFINSAGELQVLDMSGYSSYIGDGNE